MHRSKSRIVVKRLRHGVRQEKRGERPPYLLPKKGAILRHDSTVRDQQTAPGNHAAVVKVIVPDHLEFGLMSAAHVPVCDLLRLNMFVQFRLAILQTHCDIGGALGPPKKIEVIAKTLAPIQRRHGAVESVLPLKSDRRVLKRSSFLVRRI